jgi:hypothetical protein
MPKFLEDKLKREYPGNPGAVFGTMNKSGAMHGNQETAKGREMEKKHMAKEKEQASGHDLREMRIEVMRGKGKNGEPGPVTGHIIHHEHVRKPSKSGAFISQDETEKYPFGPHGEPHEDGGDSLSAHVERHLGFDGSDMENPNPKQSPQEAASEEED